MRAAASSSAARSSAGQPRPRRRSRPRRRAAARRAGAGGRTAPCSRAAPRRPRPRPGRGSPRPLARRRPARAACSTSRAKRAGKSGARPSSRGRPPQALSAASSWRGAPCAGQGSPKSSSVARSRARAAGSRMSPANIRTTLDQAVLAGLGDHGQELQLDRRRSGVDAVVLDRLDAVEGQHRLALGQAIAQRLGSARHSRRKRVNAAQKRCSSGR